MGWRHIVPGEVPIKEVFGYLLGGVAPRPIALVSTVAEDGIVNLSPFSFFNAFGANPPVIAFSPSRRLRDNRTKDTYHNLLATRECVVHAVTFDMVQQVSLASTEYPPEVNEFDKCGLTEVPSDLVKPPRVKESPFQMECRVKDIIELGGKNASGNLVLCDVIKFHISEELFENGIIQPDRINLVARMGADYYTRAVGESVFVVKKPVGQTGIGYDNLPEFVRSSHHLSANNLAQLANSKEIPSSDDALQFVRSLDKAEDSDDAFVRLEQSGDYKSMFAMAHAQNIRTAGNAIELFEKTARCALDHDAVKIAWYALLCGQQEIERH